eukprot:g27178.t1
MTSIVQSLAKLHSYDPSRLGLLAGKPFGKMGGFYQRQIQTLQRTSEAQVSNSEGQVPAMKQMPELLRLFKQNMPPDMSCVIHGDWKPDNLILSLESPPRVMAVVDWELSTIGHPMSDLANLCLPYHLGDFGKVVDYPQLGGESGISEEEAEWVATGWAESVDKGNAGNLSIASGVKYPIDHWSFYVAFACFRLAVIIQGRPEDLLAMAVAMFKSKQKRLIPCARWPLTSCKKLLVPASKHAPCAELLVLPQIR